jgi:hypothetical protein
MTLCVASQRVFIAVVYFVIDSIRKLSDTPSYVYQTWSHTLREEHKLTIFGNRDGRRICGRNKEELTGR